MMQAYMKAIYDIARLQKNKLILGAQFKRCMKFIYFVSKSFFLHMPTIYEITQAKILYRLKNFLRLILLQIITFNIITFLITCNRDIMCLASQLSNPNFDCSAAKQIIYRAFQLA